MGCVSIRNRAIGAQWLLLVSIGWLGCQADLPDNTFACQSDADCPPAQVCIGASDGISGICSRAANQSLGDEGSGTGSLPTSGSGENAGSESAGVGASGQGAAHDHGTAGSGAAVSGSAGMSVGTAGDEATAGAGTLAPAGASGSAAGQAGMTLAADGGGSDAGAAGAAGVGAACAVAQPSVTADGCCPAGANAANDVDCKPACGNAAIEMGETCDPVSSCPTASNCKSTNSCLVATLSGSATACTAKCDLAPITTCKSGDGCCAAGCNYGSDTDCSQSCGDGVVSGAETCEANSKTQPCATSCDDSNACTTDILTGMASQCNVSCTHTPIAGPANGDGCCPSNANATNDSDCKPTCGNKVVEAGERCDGNCPTSCDDGNACTTDTLTGSAAKCGAVCSSVAITACKNGDGCCAPGCTNSDDNDCMARCGDGHIDAGESCDGNCPNTAADCNDNMACTTDSVTGTACTRQCAHATISKPSLTKDNCCPAGANAGTDADCGALCGNHVIEPPETCDDGNTASGDGCSSQCVPDDNTATPGDDRALYVTCGAQSCMGPAQACCQFTSPPQCMASGTPCGGSIGACDGPEDCGAATPICWGFISGGGSACETMDQTMTGGGELCHTSHDCTMGMSCNSNGFCNP